MNLITFHLNSRHQIFETEQQRLKSAFHTSSASTPIPKPPKPFNDLLYKQKFIDWVIQHNISFTAAVAEDLQKLFAFSDSNNIETIAAVLPESATTLSTWIHEFWEAQRIIIENKLAVAQGKINLLFNAWKAGN